jgi:hypothetical protein
MRWDFHRIKESEFSMGLELIFHVLLPNVMQLVAGVKFANEQNDFPKKAIMKS